MSRILNKAEYLFDVISFFFNTAYFLHQFFWNQYLLSNSTHTIQILVGNLDDFKDKI